MSTTDSDSGTTVTPHDRVHRSETGVLVCDNCDGQLEWTDDGVGQRCSECGWTIAETLDETMALLGMTRED
jgi:ribosomal protein L37AE/L43A